MPDPTLLRDWERTAAKEVAETLYLITQGSYANVGELIFRLRDIASYLAQEHSSPNIQDDARQIFNEIMGALTGHDYPPPPPPKIQFRALPPTSEDIENG